MDRINVKELSKILNISRPTYYRYLTLYKSGGVIPKKVRVVFDYIKDKSILTYKDYLEIERKVKRWN